MIDIEVAVAAYLKAETGSRIVLETPSSLGSAWVKVLLHPVEDKTKPTDHLNLYPLQLDCYAGVDGPEGRTEAFELAQEVRAAMLAIDLPNAVVTSSVVRGPRRLPDPDFNPARQRYIMDVDLHVHP